MNPSRATGIQTGYTTTTGARIRGGPWFSDADYCRVADRRNAEPDYRINYLGFRAAFVPQSGGLPEAIPSKGGASTRKKGRR